MKIMHRLIRVALLAMVLLSIFLSSKIWNNSGNTVSTSENQVRTSLVQLKSAPEVFLPTKLVYHKENQFSYTNRESLISNLFKQTLKFNYKSLVSSKQLDGELMNKIQKQEKSISFVFPAPISLEYFLTINNVSMRNKSQSADMSFDQMILSVTDKKIYYFNDQTNEMASVGISSSMTSLVNTIENKNNQYYVVSKDHEILPNSYYFDTKVQLKKYSYILSTQNYSLFTQAFFNQVNDLSSNDQSDTKNINITNSSGEILSIQSDTGEVSYLGKLQKNEKRAQNNIYGNTFQYVARIGSTFGNLRYFDQSSGSVTYRNYIEGFPLFSNYSRGRIMLTVINNNLRIQANQETIQVPIPSDEKVVLKTTGETIQDLLDAGVPKTDIQDIQIGYTWEQSTQDEQLVNLTPNWYVKYKRNWESVSELIKQFQTNTATVTSTTTKEAAANGFSQD